MRAIGIKHQDYHILRPARLIALAILIALFVFVPSGTGLAQDAAPKITYHPPDQSVHVGGTATFRIEATGNPAPAYQWQQLTTGSSIWYNIEGATKDSFEIEHAALDMDGNIYQCVATNIHGEATSLPATLYVSDPSLGPPYRILYDANGGVGAVPIDDKKYAGDGPKEATVLFDPLPTKADHTFSGWATTPDATEPIYTKSGTEKFIITKNTTLYAVYFSDEYLSSDYEYSLIMNQHGASTNTLEIIKYNGDKQHLKVPGKAFFGVVEYPVAAIGEGAFRENPYVVSITLPDSVTSIGNNAFSGCAALKTVMYMGECPSAPSGSNNYIYNGADDGLVSWYLPANSASWGNSISDEIWQGKAAKRLDEDPEIITTSLPDANDNHAYSQTLAAMSASDVSWSIVSGSLPTGLTLDTSTGEISGMPIETGKFTFKVKATNEQGATSEVELTIAVNDKPFRIGNKYYDSLQRAASADAIGKQTTIDVLKDCSVDGITVIVSKRRILLNLNGYTLTGTSNSGIVYIVVFGTLAVEGGSLVNITVFSMSTDTVILNDVSFTGGGVVCENGRAVVEKASSLGQDPTITLTKSGDLATVPVGSGIKVATGTYDSTTGAVTEDTVSKMQATCESAGALTYGTDASGIITSAPGGSVVKLLPAARITQTVGITNNITLDFSGLSGTDVDAIFAGGGNLSLGTNVSVTVMATDTIRLPVNGRMITIGPGQTVIYGPSPVYYAPVITTEALPNGGVGEDYSHALEATGDLPITWAIAAGALPEGLELAASGMLTGVPQAPGAFTFTVRATNFAGSDEGEFTIDVKKDDPPPEPEPVIEMISDVIALKNGGTRKLSKPAGTAVEWRSTDTDVVIVGKKGKITAVGTGSCEVYMTVTAADTGSVYKIGNFGKAVVNVYKKSAKLVKIVALDKKIAVLAVGETFRLAPSIKPLKAVDQQLKYTTNKPSVATVDQNGKVTAVAPGKCRIRVQSTTKNHAILKVTVKEAAKQSAPKLRVVERVVIR